MAKYKYIEFEQPIGEFLFAVIPAIELLDFYSINKREYTGDKSEGVQRKINTTRVEEIADYCNTIDASFPTSFIITLQENNYINNIQKHEIEITGKAEIIDGQHRIAGLKRASEKYGLDLIKKFELPCVIVLEATEEQKAFIFATINGKQQKVPQSVVYDLFGISETKDPYNIVHTIARKLNFSEGSPFQNKLKMLGNKTEGIDTESLTQGTFSKYLIEKITKDGLRDRDLMRRDDYDKLEENSKLVLRDYMLYEQDELIYPIIKNLFNAVKNTFPIEWENHKDFILSKTTGYIGIMKSVDDIIQFGKQEGILTEQFFVYIMKRFKSRIETLNLKLINDDFPSGAKGQNLLASILQEVWSVIKNAWENDEKLKKQDLESFKKSN